MSEHALRINLDGEDRFAIHRAGAAAILRVTPETLDTFKLQSWTVSQTVFDGETIMGIAMQPPAFVPAIQEAIQHGRERFGELVSAKLSAADTVELTFERGTVTSTTRDGKSIHRATAS